jgi:hypothetical protein
MSRFSTYGVTVVNFIIAVVLILAFAFVIFYKLFALSAQVKALEVNPQAGRWNRLLVAYAIETETLGSFKEIGFVPYGKLAEDGESSKSSTFSYSSDLENGKGRFLAINIIGLDNCKKKEGHWFAYGNIEQFAGNAVAEPPIKRCAVLTPNFELFRDFF